MIIMMGFFITYNNCSNSKQSLNVPEKEKFNIKLSLTLS